MNKHHKTLGLTSAAALLFSLSAAATTYNGNGSTGFGGPIGNGMLTFSNDGINLTGTLTPGSNSGTNTVYDELVVYISTGVLGSSSTAGFTDDGGAANGDKLREAASGYDATAAGGTVRSTVNFSAGFSADYALVLSPVGVGYSALFALPGVGTATASSFTFLNTANLTPTAAAGPYTFSIPLSSIGSPSSFQFSTTYLDSHDADTINRSNEGFNAVTDTTTATNTGNPGQDTVTVGSNTYQVPEPGTWAMIFAGATLSTASFRQVLSSGPGPVRRGGAPSLVQSPRRRG